MRISVLVVPWYLVLATTLVASIIPLEHLSVSAYFYAPIFALVILDTRLTSGPAFADPAGVALIVCALALVPVYWDATTSVVNLAAIMLCALALMIAVNVLRVVPVERVDVEMVRAMWVSLIASVVLSTAMTASGVREAPTFFFWESFVGTYRLKLLQGRVGHSTSLWLTAFLFAWYCAALTRQLLGERPTGKNRPTWRIVCWLAILAAMLFATKTRLSLMIMGAVVLSCGAAFALRSLRVGVIVCVLLSGTYMTSITTLLLAPSLQAPIDEVSTQVQSYVPWLRIEGIRSSTGEAGASNDALFTGRTILTQALLQLALDHPLTGVGRESPIIDPGVDASGRAPIMASQIVAAIESPLRNAAKFGFVFFAVVLMQVFATLYLLLVNRSVRLEHALFVAVVTITATTEGTLENLYGLGGLFFFLLCFVRASARNDGVRARLTGWRERSIRT
jgi:hypothetical protein